MRISDNVSPSFGIKFINNAAYKDVKRYAIKNGHGEEFKTLTGTNYIKTRAGV